LLAAAAEEMGTLVAIISQVPFQPMFDGKKEDEIISYTFEQFLHTGDTEWPLLLPMVKAAVRAMDTVQDFSNQEWSHEIETFTVTGASKRGWTTWLTGATDARVTAIAPMVIDVLNMQKHMQHQIATWGEYSEQISDYTDRGLQDHLASEPGAALRRIVDPYHHLHNIQQPKLLMIGTNDRYWPLDSLNLYWDDLNGDKHVLYVPNNGHGLNDFQRVIGSLNALHQMAARGKVLPKIDWSFLRDGDNLLLHVESNQRPSKVQAWTAMAPKRDFRDAKWTAELAEQNGGKFVHRLPIPAAGFAAVFGEAVFDSGTLPFFLSTNVRIVSSSDDR
jgi:PhoPQ-activated pathogenicity-related protein